MAWSSVVALVIGSTVRVARPDPLPEGVASTPDVVYRDTGGRARTLDIYWPTGEAPRGGRPCVLAIHGGGWRGGSKRGFGRMVARLATHGYVVIAPEYTLSRPGTPGWPTTFEDLREAVRWVRRRAEMLGIDPTRISAVGASAGGHLAELLGTFPDSEGRGDVSARVRAVVAFYAPADLAANATASPAAGAMIEVFLGGPPTAEPARYEAASPTRHASSDDAPMLLIHGTADDSVPPDQSVEMARALDRAGVPHRLIVLEGAPHGFGFRVGSRDLLPDVLGFLGASAGPSISRETPARTSLAGMW